MLTNIFVFLCVLFFFQNPTDGLSSRKVLLRDVTTLTLLEEKKTEGRRSSPIPQLQRIGGTADGMYKPKVVQCYNRGFDGNDVQWECIAEMPSDYHFGKIDVSCEGYDYPDDPFILQGSCGLRYELDYTENALKSGKYPATDIYDYFLKLVLIAVVIFVLYLIYCSITGPSPSLTGGSGGGDWPGSDDRRPPPPYGWSPPPPSYDQSTQNSKRHTQSNSSDSGPGFWSGMALGGLGGYLFGGANSNRYDGFRRRWGYNYGYDSYYNTPSTSSGYRNNDFSSSSTTHSSSGYGGTSRR